MKSFIAWLAMAAGAAALLAPAAAAAQHAPAPASGGGASDEQLARDLSNPVAAMISVPLQLNYDCCYGPNDGERITLNIQPVIPFRLNDNWNLIVRTILPVVYQASPTVGGEDHFGLSDTTQSFLFSPHGSNGFTWAIGPVFTYPTGTTELGSRMWGAGPTALILKQQGHVTYGALVNHIWSYAGVSDRDSVSQTFLQPFLSYTTPSATTYSLNTEASYDWTHGEWTVPINVSVSHLVNFNGQRVSLGIGGKFYAVRPERGPEWGIRAIATFLFPA